MLAIVALVQRALVDCPGASGGVELIFINSGWEFGCSAEMRFATSRIGEIVAIVHVDVCKVMWPTVNGWAKEPPLPTWNAVGSQPGN